MWSFEFELVEVAPKEPAAMLEGWSAGVVRLGSLRARGWLGSERFEVGIYVLVFGSWFGVGKRF